jgi:Ran GTPase-activating protein (RanGAP) involved in mRNA processing and transport
MSTVFSIKGKGLKLTSREDIQPHLDALKALGDNVEEVHLGGNTLGIEASEALAEVLKTLPKLKVRWSYSFLGRSWHSLLSTSDLLFPTTHTLPPVNRVRTPDPTLRSPTSPTSSPVDSSPRSLKL